MKQLLILPILFISQLAMSDTVWLDVRSMQEYQQDHVEGAVHIPHTQINKSAAELLKNKDDEVLIYCRSGRRAGIAEAALKEMGYNNVRNILSLPAAKKLKASY